MIWTTSSISEYNHENNPTMKSSIRNNMQLVYENKYVNYRLLEQSITSGKIKA